MQPQSMEMESTLQGMLPTLLETHTHHQMLMATGTSILQEC